MAVQDLALQRTIGAAYQVIDGTRSWDEIAAHTSSVFSSPFVYIFSGKKNAVFGKDRVAFDGFRSSDRRLGRRLADPFTDLFTANAGRVVELNHLMERDSQFGRRFLNDRVRPGRHAHMIGISGRRGDHPRAVLLARTRDQRPFDRHDLGALARLSSHIGRVTDVVSWGHSQAQLQVPTIATLRTTFSMTAREASVAQEIARGLSVEQIAMALGIGRETVRFHVRNVLDKCDAPTCRQLAERFSTRPLEPGACAAGTGKP